MTEPQRNILAYEPIDENQRRRRKLWFLAGGVGILLLIVLIGLLSFSIRVTAVGTVATGQPVPIGRDGLSANSSAFGVPYNKWFLLENQATYIAIRISASTAQSEPIVYEWIQSPRGQRLFNPQTSAQGKGSTFEVGGNGTIATGPLTIPWSKGGPTNGWLYWSIHSTPNLKLSDIAYDDIQQLNKPARREKWYTPRGPFP